MNKYITPIIELTEIEVADVITSSSGVEITALEGVDSGDTKSAVFNVNFWFSK